MVWDAISVKSVDNLSLTDTVKFRRNFKSFILLSMRIQLIISLSEKHFSVNFLVILGTGKAQINTRHLVQSQKL